MNSETLREYLPEFNDLNKIKLKEHWKKFTEEKDVIGFYQQKHPYFGSFSNFYKLEPYEFELPYKNLDINDDEKQYFPSPIICTNSEKTIMLCKAALMGDKEIYNQISSLENPKEIKRLGRLVKNFDQDKWNKYLCLIAFECVFQKFSKASKQIQEYLKLTNTAIIAEAAYRDLNWGIGLGVNQYISKPADWRGSNVLGWALMETRARIFS